MPRNAVHRLQSNKKQNRLLLRFNKFATTKCEMFFFLMKDITFRGGAVFFLCVINIIGNKMLLRLSCVVCCACRAKPINCSFLLYVCTIKTHRLLFKKNTRKKQNWFFTPYRTRLRCSNRFICLAQSFHLIIDRWQRGGRRWQRFLCVLSLQICIFTYTYYTHIH